MPPSLTSAMPCKVERAQLHVWLLANRGPTTISIHDAVEHTLKY
jgi:hypothetical protein